MLWLRKSHFEFDNPWQYVSFRLQAAFDVVAAPGWIITAASQPAHELWLIESGACEVVSGERQAHVRKGDIVLINEKLPRLSTNSRDEPLGIIGFSFHATLLESVDFIKLLDLPICQTFETTRLRFLLRELVEASRQENVASSLLTHGLAQTALGEVLRQSSTRSSHILDDERLRRDLRATLDHDVVRALEYIAAHFREPIEARDWANAAHLSSKHLARKFKAALGIAPNDYLRAFRLNRARESLSDSQNNVARVAQECGFDDAAYFSRAFKTRFGLSPLEYRRQTRALRPKNRAEAPKED